MNPIRIGTRKSMLALWQANWVRSRLTDQGFPSKLVTMETRGDKILDVTLSKIGSKGVFTEELEEKLKIGDIDIAVHSAKDMPSDLPSGFEILAFTEREIVNDVLVSHKEIDLTSALVIGTSSTRRVAYLKKSMPHVTQVDMRGNLQTRIKKMESGIADAILLAAAGVIRMEMQHLIRHTFPSGEWIPAVGQGSIAIESYRHLGKAKKELIRNCLNHPETESCLLAERAFLYEMNGGCSIPVFGLATSSGPDISITGGIVSLDGKDFIQKNLIGNNPILIGQKLAKEVLEDGGDRILTEIRKQI